MSQMLSSDPKTLPKIKVVAIGGGAINAVNHMIDCGMQDMEFIAISRDKLGVKCSKAPIQILIGENRPVGLGRLPVADCREIAEEARGIIKKHLCGADIVFVVACMGGNTASGVASVVAACAREVVVRTVAVATKPFMFEGVRRRKIAEEGISELKENVDVLITISNDCLFQVLDKKTSMLKAFHAVDDVIRRCVRSVADLLAIPGLANIEFKEGPLPLLKDASVDIEEEQLMGLPKWLGRDKTDDKQETPEELMPRSDGKQVCAYLRNMRMELARANSIPFESEPCNFKGSCAGTCAKCDQEAAYLREELEKIPEQKRKYPQHILSDWGKAICTGK